MPNPRLLFVAVVIVGVILALTLVFIGLLAMNGQPIPDVLQNIAVGSLTGLVGLLVQTRRDEQA